MKAIGSIVTKYIDWDYRNLRGRGGRGGEEERREKGRVGVGEPTVTGDPNLLGIPKLGDVPLAEPCPIPDEPGLIPATPGSTPVTIYKAPQPGLGQKLLEKGFHPEDFSAPYGDNLVYFAKERKLAQDYAKHYRNGVLEVDIPKDIYELRIKQHELPYQGEPEIEIPIPHKDFDC